MQKLLIILFIWISTVTLLSGDADAAGPEPILTPHSFLTVSTSGLYIGSVVVTEVPEKTTTHQGFDKESLIVATHKTLKSDSSRMKLEEIRSLEKLRGYKPVVLDENTFEVDLSREERLNEFIAYLSQLGMEVTDFRAKGNRIEKLFLNILKAGTESGAEV